MRSQYRRLQAARGLRRLVSNVAFRRTARRAQRSAPDATDILSKGATVTRNELRVAALEALVGGIELGVASATRGERQQLRELSAILRRDQQQFRNFSMFDRLKAHPDWAERLLKLLPVWIVTPDDAARLFPAKAGLFDVVIVDEASQVDLPSISPIAFRGKKVVVLGDTKQMQPRRFAFVSQQVAFQAWRHHNMHRLDPDGWLDPLRQSLLTLATVRAEEENLLNKHYRSLPSIIHFSNDRWYGNELRIMTDERRKRFGGPEQPAIALHYVPDGLISNGSQENEDEARALVEFLSKMVRDPDYRAASIGVLCLFEEQVALIQTLIADRIPSEEWEEHKLVVVNPDGFQGDERDVILYSLSWDNKNMPREALSQRQREHPHEQGMLNVAFTRGRDELHIFHSAPIETFTKRANRVAGAITDWLHHCASIAETDRGRPIGSRFEQVDSEFEADVASALRANSVKVLHQYPSCGFSIDLVCERDGSRVAVECDGWTHHADEHGRLKAEDLERQAILERAGWTVVRVPYRKWLKDSEAEIAKILNALDGSSSSSAGADSDSPRDSPSRADATKIPPHKVNPNEQAIASALREGLTDYEDVLRRARELRGHKRLGSRIREELSAAAESLRNRGLLMLEDQELFLTPEGRGASLDLDLPAPPSRKIQQEHQQIVR